MDSYSLMPLAEQVGGFLLGALTLLLPVVVILLL